MPREGLSVVSISCSGMPSHHHPLFPSPSRPFTGPWRSWGWPVRRFSVSCVTLSLRCTAQGLLLPGALCHCPTSCLPPDPSQSVSRTTPLDGVSSLSPSFPSGLLHELEQLVTGIALLRELTPSATDYLVSFGERCSTRIFAALLNSRGMRAVQVGQRRKSEGRSGGGNRRHECCSCIM